MIAAGTASEIGTAFSAVKGPGWLDIAFTLKLEPRWMRRCNDVAANAWSFHGSGLEIFWIFPPVLDLELPQRGVDVLANALSFATVGDDAALRAPQLS